MTSLVSGSRPRLAAFLFLLVAASWGATAWLRAGPRPPADHWAEVERARGYFARGRPDMAFQAVQGVRDEAPGAAEALALAARALILHGDARTARLALERSLRLNPDQADAAKMLAAIYLASGDAPRGLALLQSASRLEPDDFRPWYAMGKVYHDMGDVHRSADAYGEALKRSPPWAEGNESRVGRLRSLIDAHRDAEAADALAEAREAMPDDAAVLGLAARMAADSRDAEEVDRLAGRALDLDPGQFDARLARARVRMVDGRWAEAVDDVGRALQSNPNDLAALQLHAQALARLGREDEAEEARARFRASSRRVALMDELTHEINRRPDDPEPRLRMGLAAAEGGMDELARNCFRAALEIDPGHRPAREALAALKAGRSIPPSPSAAAASPPSTPAP